ncbi:DNA-directed RNA polymerase specialized sigma subunit, sigma24 family [Chitinophaga sp. CF118]|uniref:sigma-70 family RNA polymerase sigma factor n=1 Tax=Chitinophaga sp. CF118 TaxID=1884367 RepID=UPI0008E00059|nr:sigma-70 family RNA polymerase sigma factor [Chitinophaga sp. CF118]SFD52235.1 DNA-directed RNA polymerase specialized sigma subunit, sigma24 family [Chitinophaga sp. CF118]
MLQQLTNLSDKELISRARKLRDLEAEGVLFERYSHLLVAISMPYLNNGPGTTPEEMYPVILQRLSNSIKTQTIPKTSEWIHYTVKALNNKSERNSPFFPSSESREVQQVENSVEKAGNNLLEQQQLVIKIRHFFSQLDADEKYFLQQFYTEQKSFAELAAAKECPVEKVRQKLREGKQKIASLMMTQTDGK